MLDRSLVFLDLETTGASARDCAITEVGAVRLRGGECLGRLETLINPGVPIPPMITGICFQSASRPPSRFPSVMPTPKTTSTLVTAPGERWVTCSRIGAM